MRKRHYVMLALLFLAALLSAGASAAQGPPDGTDAGILGGPPLTESFTYQGYFEDGGQPAKGAYDFRFYIWSAESGGSQIATCQAFDNQYVEDGLFAFYLMPGIPLRVVFSGEERWIEVRVRQHGAATWTILPRQPITPTPYAWTLHPGAVVTGTIANAYMFRVGNAYDAGTVGGAIYAENHAATSPTIYAQHYGTGNAFAGYTDSSYPTIGANNYGTGTGITAYSEEGAAVDGYIGSTGDPAVMGRQPGYGISDISGYWNPGGFFAGRNGLIGYTEEPGGYAVVGWNHNTTNSFSYGLYAQTDSPNAWAGYFHSAGNGVYASVGAAKTGISTNGTKPAVVATSEGPTLLYSEESAEVWFTDYGFGKLKGGVALVTIDPLWAETVNLEEPYHVFVQAYGPGALYVTDRTPKSFTVHAQEGDPDVEFSYRIVATRLGYEGERLEPAPWAANDANLYPETAGQHPQGQEAAP